MEGSHKGHYGNISQGVKKTYHLLRISPAKASMVTLSGFNKKGWGEDLPSIGRIIAVFRLCPILGRYVTHRSLPRATSESIAQASGRGKSGVSGRFFRGETGLRGKKLDMLVKGLEIHV